MRAVLCAVMAVLCAGCATARSTYTADGRQGHAIQCGGWMQTWDNCYTKAGELCGSRGYDVLAKDGDSTYQASGSGQNYQAGQIITRSLLVACK